METEGSTGLTDCDVGDHRNIGACRTCIVQSVGIVEASPPSACLINIDGAMQFFIVAIVSI